MYLRYLHLIILCRRESHCSRYTTYRLCRHEGCWGLCSCKFDRQFHPEEIFHLRCDWPSIHNRLCTYIHTYIQNIYTYVRRFTFVPLVLDLLRSRGVLRCEPSRAAKETVRWYLQGFLLCAYQWQSKCIEKSSRWDFSLQNLFGFFTDNTVAPKFVLENSMPMDHTNGYVLKNTIIFGFTTYYFQRQ